MANQTAVAHCPLSNAYFSEKPFPLREALDKGVLVGLGTDVAGGYSIDILNSMRHAVATSRMCEGVRALRSKSEGANVKSLAVEWKESLFLATRGGALALGLENTGEFRVGAAFDAQHSKYQVNPRVRPLNDSNFSFCFRLGKTGWDWCT